MASLSFVMTLLSCLCYLQSIVQSVPLENRSKENLLKNRIVGGEDVCIEDFPYQVYIKSNNGNCGGSILSKRYILTAAQCVVNRHNEKINACNITILLGWEYSVHRQPDIKISKFVVHPQYHNLYRDYDVAILELEEDLEINDQQRPIALVDAGTVTTAGTICEVAGWGSIGLDWYEQPIYNIVLQFAVVSTISQEECKRHFDQYGVLTDRMICTNDEDTGACLGDFGSPLVENDVQIGIASWGKNCWDDPVVYTNIAHPDIRNWIYNITEL